jgi:multiple sugar transport system permease protein
MGGIPILGFFLFGFIPMIISGYLGFTELHSFDFTDAKFIGFENYKKIFDDPLFYKSVVNTLYALLAIPLQMFLGLIIANVLTKKEIKGKKLFRALFFIPFVCSTVAVTLIFKWIFDAEFGIINQILTYLNGENINFLLNEKLFMPIMILIMSWAGTGYYIIIFQAALTGINQSVIEAAEMDGAGSVRKFYSIIIPTITPTIFYLLIMGIIGGLQTFTWFQVICSGMAGRGFQYGPNNAGITIVFYLYEQGFGNIFTYGMGIASASAWILVFGILLLTFINFKLSKRWVHYED